MSILKIEMFGTHESAMTRFFIDFDLSPQAPTIYKADSGGSRTFSFQYVNRMVTICEEL